MKPCSADKPKFLTLPNQSFNWEAPFPATMYTLFFLSFDNSVNRANISSLGLLSLNNLSTFTWPVSSLGSVPS